MIELKNITKKYGERIILNQVYLQFVDNSLNIIYGASGSGKSTLLNIIGLLDRDYQGDIIIDKQENPSIFKQDGQELLRNHISYLFQNYGLIENETVYQNLKIITDIKNINKNSENQLMVDALKQVGLTASVLKQKIHNLSGGEQQRIALAKIILKQSDIIICDEPTGSLDDGNKKRIMEIIKSLKAKIVIIVSHDQELVDYADHIYQLTDGKLEQIK